MREDNPRSSEKAAPGIIPEKFFWRISLPNAKSPGGAPGQLPALTPNFLGAPGKLPALTPNAREAARKREIHRECLANLPNLAPPGLLAYPFPGARGLLRILRH